MSGSPAFERLADDVVAAELESRGMQRVEDSLFARALTPGISGRVWLGQFDPPHLAQDSGFVCVSPTVGVRHEATGQLVGEVRGLARDDRVRSSAGVVSQLLRSLIPGSRGPRMEWVMRSEDDAADVARVIADDIVFRGFPYMERLRSPEEILAEMSLPLRRDMRRYERAVLSMLCGRPEGAVRVLMEKLPVTQDPTVWGDPAYGPFLDAFSAHFGVDLHTESWPVREQRSPGKATFKLNIREWGVVRAGLLSAERPDLAEAAAGLTDRHLREIEERAADVLEAMQPKDFGQAVGLAAADLMDSWSKAPNQALDARGRADHGHPQQLQQAIQLAYDKPPREIK